MRATPVKTRRLIKIRGGSCRLQRSRMRTISGRARPGYERRSSCRPAFACINLPAEGGRLISSRR